MMFDDAFDDGETESGARNPSSRVKWLIDTEEAVEIGWVDSDSIITDAEDPFCVLFFCADVDVGCDIFFFEFNGVIEEVLEDS